MRTASQTKERMKHMRKTSAKPLSLALSLLLAICVLFSLPFGVWAETEAVPGDLNGDKLVDANDVTILEAVLDGSQTAAAGVNYDICGNKMVDSEDLTVLKNMVDPNEPALADKLADGTTDDLLELVTNVTGGQLQRAVVRGGGAITSDCPRGSSTRALELDGGAMTVLFAEVQDWSAKGTLEMDTLWASGDRTVTVLLLGADGETILGTPIVVTAEENGWSRISLPLTGILAKERAKIGGIMVTAADDAQVYMDNLALIAAEEAEDALTRADLENALGEMAWNWYFKGAAYDYDSTPLNSVSQPLSQPLAGYGGGKSRLTLFPTLEDATSHSSVYTVCSGFAFDLYYTALGYPILGSKYNSLTMTFWRNSSYYPGYVRDAEGAYDMTVLRWHSMGKNTSYDINTADTTDYDTEFFTYYKDENGNIVYNNWYDKEADLTDPDAVSVEDFFANYEENLRPGDIIVPDSPGHTLIYIGNGIIMDDNGTKYNMETGEDTREMNGSLYHNTFYDRFLNPEKTQFNIEILLGKATNNIVVLRPLNLMLIDDGDGDPSNDRLNPDYELNTGLLKYVLSHDKTTEVKTSGYGIDEITQTRLQYPAMNIDRTVNITPYGTAAKGDTITYSVKITNNTSNDKYIAYRQAGGEAGYAGEAYENLWVVEHIPANTQLHSAPNATVVGDTLRWNITVPAGETVELTYTVTVTGEIGDTIVSGGGWVNNIPSNTITNIIGGKKLSGDHQSAMASNGITGITATGTDLAEQIYKNATGQDLELPEVQALMDIFYAEYKYQTDYGYYLYYNSSGITRYMYKLNAKAPTLEDKLYYDMLVPGYYGGMWCYTDELNGPSRINSLRAEYLEVGDILVYMDLTPSTDYGKTSQDRVVESYTVLVYLGNSTFASVDQAGNVTTRNDAIAYTEALKHDLFLCLRPSQSYEDLSSGIPSYTITWEDAEGNVVETDENVPYGYVPTYEGAEPTKEGYTFTGWSPAIRPADGNITYKPVFIARDLSAGKLTDSELDALAAITPEMVQDAYAYYALSSTNTHEVLPWIYQQAGLSVPTELSTNKIYATRNLLFTTSGGLAVNASPAAPYTTMLVTNAYGGAQMKEEARVDFDINYLQVGDIFCAAFDKAQTGADATYYYTFLYQGDGKFLSISEDAAVCTTEEVLNRVYTYKEVDYNWSYFFVIRPENYNSATRDITLRSLTDAEKYALSKLTYGSSSRWIHTIVPNIYAAVDINITMAGSKLSQESVRGQLFTWNDPTTKQYLIPMEASGDATKLFYQKMMLPYYNGTQFTKNPDLILEDLESAIEKNILKVGDVLSGAYLDADYSNTVSVFAALYQGGKDFLVVYYKYDDTAAAQKVQNVLMTAAEIDALTFRYCYALRPNNLAIVSDDATFTVTWVNEDGTVLETDTNAVGTLPSYDGETPVKTDAQYTYTFAGWTPLTTSVNRDVTYTATYTKTVRNYTVTWLNEDGTELEKDENVPYGTVPTYDGDTPAKAADEEFAYDFAGWDQEISEVTGDVTYTATFFSIRDLAAHKLTEEEMAALAAITPEAAQAALTHTNLTNVAPWIYRQAKIDYSSNHGLATVYNTLTKLFDKDGLYWSLKDSIAAPYTTMLVPGTYGGTQVVDAPAFKLGYLQAGDFFCAAYDTAQTGTGSTVYYVYLYQGDGNFLLLRDDYSVVRWYEVLSRTYTCDSGVYNWSYYFAIRPENYNGALRDPALRELTDAEIYRLSKLTGEDIGYTSRNIHGTVSDYYEAVGIDVTMPKDTDGKDMTQERVRNKLFAWSEGVLVLRDAGDDELMRYFQKLMVPCYGGSQFAEDTQLTVSDAIAGNVLKIGDVVAGTHTNAYDGGTEDVPLTALYQGNGNFLVFYYTQGTMTKSTWTAGQVDELNFLYYYTLRPNNMATVSEEDTFTVTWVNEDGAVLETDENVALYTHPSYDGETPTKAADAQYTYTFAGWTPVIIPANSDITYTAVYSKTVNTYTVTWADADGSELETDTVPYGEVPTYDGARPYSSENKGFAGWDQEITAVTGDVTYTATYTALRDMTAGGLTDAEKEILSSLTLDDYTNAGSRSLESMLPWVYKEAGIDITSAYGYASRTSAQISNTLSGNSGLYKDYYTKIAVAGSYGKDVTGAGTDDLQVGDIFVAAYAWVPEGYPDKEGYMYFVAVCLDEGEFLVAYDKAISYNAETDKFSRTGASAITSFEQIEEVLTLDTFTTWAYRYVLRPSQLADPCTVTWKDANGTAVATEEVTYGTAYDAAPTKTVNGYTYTFGDAEGTVVTTDVTYTATSYTRALTAHKLNNGELAALAAITPEDVANSLTGTNLGAVGPWAYNRANIEYSSTYGGVNSVYNTMNKFFTLSSQRWTLKTSIDAAYASMLVPGTYGGTQVNDAPAFDVTYLQIGDLFCAAYDKQQTGVSTAYYVYLYQGNGNFLLLRSGSDIFSYTDVLSRTYSGSNGTFNWSYYFVIRPEEYNDPGARDITLRNLTSAEKYQLSKLTTMGYPSRNLGGTLPAYYTKVGITVTLPLGSDGKVRTHENIRNQLFQWSNSVLVPAEATDDTMRLFQKMAIGVQGGGNFALADRVDISDAIDGGVLQIGDVLAGYHRNVYTLDGAEKSEDVVFTAMYQGNNTFLVYYFATNESTGNQEMSRTTWTTDQVEALDFYWFYTLRPDNLAN